MKWLFSLLIILSSTPLFAKVYTVTDFLEGRIPIGNIRHKTFQTALLLMQNRNHRIIVETGTARFGKQSFGGDGGSTIIFAHFCAAYKRKLYSVDTNQDHLNQAFKAVVPYQRFVNFVCDDSISFLESFSEPIDFLYLDSFDYVYENPFPSQLHHLKEIQVAYDKLSPHAVVMIDDCNLPGGGKGKLVIEFLKARGWNVLASDYQVILSR